MNRIDHTSHQHPATPAARKACRKATRAQEIEDSKIGKAPQDWSEEAKAATQRVDAYPAPFLSRAIKVSFKLKNGQRVAVVFDRYGMNRELFDEAAANGWSADRTVAQACSNAIHAVMEANGANSIEHHTVHTID